jgi:hypothetical protein
VPDRRLSDHAASVALLGFSTLAGVYLASAALTGQLGGLVDPTDVFHLHAGTRTNLVIALVATFTVWAGLTTPPHTRAAVRELVGEQPPSDAALALPDRWLARSAWPAVALGSGFGLMIVLVSNYRFFGGWDWSWDFRSYWNLLLMLALFGLMGELARSTLLATRTLSEIGHHHFRVRLLDPEGLRPFASCVLRICRNWFIGSAIAMLMLFDVKDWLFVIAPIALTTGLGLACLILPALGIHGRLQQAKRAELTRVRAAIEKRRESLFEAEASMTSRAAELPALLAYEARIQQVSEWPFDPSTLLRFSLFVLIPLASWVAGAIVERVVDAALG